MLCERLRLRGPAPGSIQHLTTTVGVLRIMNSLLEHVFQIMLRRIVYLLRF